MNRSLTYGAFALLLAVTSSCGGDDGIIGGPGAPWIAGDYVTTSKDEVSDTCGWTYRFVQEPWSITQETTNSGDPSGQAVIHAPDEGMDDGCRDIGISWHDGMWTYSAKNSEDADGCVYDWSSEGTVDFSDAAVVLTQTTHYTFKSGNCDGWTLPCDYQLRLRARPCDGCWPGCATPASVVTTEERVPGGRFPPSLTPRRGRRHPRMVQKHKRRSNRSPMR